MLLCSNRRARAAAAATAFESTRGRSVPTGRSTHRAPRSCRVLVEDRAGSGAHDAGAGARLDGHDLRAFESEAALDRAVVGARRPTVEQAFEPVLVVDHAQADPVGTEPPQRGVPHALEVDCHVCPRRRPPPRSSGRRLTDRATTAPRSTLDGRCGRAPATARASRRGEQPSRRPSPRGGPPSRDAVDLDAGQDPTGVRALFDQRPDRDRRRSRRPQRRRDQPEPPQPRPARGRRSAGGT